EDCKEKKSSVVVMFVDINYMKRINDEFGHLHGDNAIKTVAESITRNVREDWIAVRYGGDEFLIVGPDCDVAGAEKVRGAILKYLDEKNHDGSQPYQISASCGYVVSDPEKDETLQDYVQEADRLMYEIKKKVHEQDGSARR
ncbi:MAG: GGDEF domain-containing protein, partial [Lachnospiraceae bacterium]|nr:GGDEF domain-containing protein [Lachnospiraceae bacterium]